METAEPAKVVPLASGVVLEVGVGSALNLRFYGPQGTRLCALDPSLPLWQLARRRGRTAAVPVCFVGTSAEAIPFGDGCRLQSGVSRLCQRCTCGSGDRPCSTKSRRPLGRSTRRISRSARGASSTEQSVHVVSTVSKRVAGGCTLETVSA